jgi:tRNA-dihydrouridine synthase B
VLTDPFLPGIIKGQAITAEGSLERFRGFHDALFARYQAILFGPSHLLNRMKGLWSYFSNGFEEGIVLRKQIHKTEKVDRYCDVVNRFLDGHPIRRKSCETGEW